MLKLTIGLARWPSAAMAVSRSGKEVLLVDLQQIVGLGENVDAQIGPISASKERVKPGRAHDARTPFQPLGKSTLS